MIFFRILLALALLFPVSLFNFIVGYGFLFGGAMEAGLNANQAELSFAEIVFTKLGGFGIFMIALATFQSAVACALPFKSRFGPGSAIFVITIAILGLLAEIIGPLLMTTFSQLNVVGIVVSILLGLYALASIR